MTESERQTIERVCQPDAVQKLIAVVDDLDRKITELTGRSQLVHGGGVLHGLKTARLVLFVELGLYE